MRATVQDNYGEVDVGDRPSSVEREAKLVAPLGINLPDLAGVMAGVTVLARAERRLDAVYYDTTDLRLARSGITLRFRRGEPGLPWTVKLPEAQHGSTLARREISFAGRPEQIPSSAVNLVVATTRGRRLVPVARLTTLRRPVEIRDPDGQPLAEMVDDTVSVSRSGRPAGQFREVEVEALDASDRGGGVLETATSRLVAAGCLAEPPVPKLLRALGERANGPPDVIVASLDGHATVAELVRHAVARSVAQIIHHDPGARLGDDPEDVHRLRVGTRRLRSDLRTFGPLLNPDPVTRVRAELGWLGAEVGEVRDADVLAIRLKAAASALPEVDGPGTALLFRRLDRQATTHRAAMLEALSERRYLRLLGMLVAEAAAPPLRGGSAVDRDRDSARVGAKLVRRPWNHLKGAVEALGPEPVDAELHRIRILAKRCRYAAEAVAPVAGRGAAKFAAAVADLQTVLGDHQDTVVAEAWLRDAATALPAARVAAGELIALERLRRAELRASWPAVWRVASAKDLRRWL